MPTALKRERSSSQSHGQRSDVFQSNARGAKQIWCALPLSLRCNQSSEHSERLIVNLIEPKKLGNFCESFLQNSLADL